MKRERLLTGESVISGIDSKGFTDCSRCRDVNDMPDLPEFIVVFKLLAINRRFNEDFDC